MSEIRWPEPKGRPEMPWLFWRQAEKRHQDDDDFAVRSLEVRKRAEHAERIAYRVVERTKDVIEAIQESRGDTPFSSDVFRPRNVNTRKKDR